MMRSGNPALRGSVFTNVPRVEGLGAMTIQGTVNKSFILLLLALIPASWAWSNPLTTQILLWPAVILGFIVAMVTVFKKEWSPVTAPIYAVLEGVFIGVISSMFERMYPGIVLQEGCDEPQGRPG